jgi:polyphosphate glucokinase
LPAAPLTPSAPQALCAAVKKLVEQAEWTGHVGVSMPGRVQVRRMPVPACAASSRAPVSRAQDFGGVSPEDWAAGRGSRAATERLLEAASGCRVVALGGAEAIGAGEIAYGAARDAPGLVMTATVGANGLGVALFEDGTLP